MLLVEDDEVVQSIVKEILEDLGCRVISAWNGTEGLDSFKKHKEKIIAIITDIRMPEMSGIAMTNQIRLIDSDIPIAIMSAFSDEDIKEAINSLNLSYFNKPARIEALAGFLDEAMLYAQPQIA